MQDGGKFKDFSFGIQSQLILPESDIFDEFSSNRVT